MNEYLAGKIIFVFVSILFLIFYKNKIKSFFRIYAGVFPFSPLRVFLLRLGGVSIGRSVSIGKYNWFGNGVKIGNNTAIGDYNLISSSEIGDSVTINNFSHITRAVIGNSTFLHRGVKFACEEGVEIGKNCNILQYCCFEGISKTIMGDNCEISSFCNFYTVSSINRALTKTSQDKEEDGKLMGGSIIIGNNVWFGPLVTVYPNVSIGSQTGVLSNSAVNQNLESKILAGGVPAKKKRSIVINEKGIDFT